MNTKLHAICDNQGRPLNLFVTAGQVSDYIGARALLTSLPDVDWLLGDRGYDADWFRDALKDKGIRACIPGRKQRTKPVKYDKRRYKRRNRPSQRMHAFACRAVMRDHVRQAQGLEVCCNPIRPLSEGLPLSNRSGCNGHLLAMSPDPR